MKEILFWRGGGTLNYEIKKHFVENKTKVMQHVLKMQ